MKKERRKFEFGDKVRDEITGYEGLTTGFTDYISGCAQYLVQPPVKEEDGTWRDSKWFDEDRLTLVTSKAHLHTVKKAGADKPAPTK